MKISRICFGLFSLLICVNAFAQDSPQGKYTKKELKKVVKLLKRPSLRVPLPILMSSDRLCYKWLLDNRKEGLPVFMEYNDSVKARHAENMWLLERLPYAAIKEEKAVRYTESLKREEKRYDCYLKELNVAIADKAAEERPAPKSELVGLSFKVLGMKYYPNLPVKVKVLEGDSVKVVYGHQESICYITKKEMDEMAKIILEGELYRLHAGYSFFNVDLPDIEKIVMLDGERWYLTLRYADGTMVDSWGWYEPTKELGKLRRYIMEHVLPNRDS